MFFPLFLVKPGAIPSVPRAAPSSLHFLPCQKKCFETLNPKLFPQNSTQPGDPTAYSGMSIPALLGMGSAKAAGLVLSCLGIPARAQASCKDLQIPGTTSQMATKIISWRVALNIFRGAEGIFFPFSHECLSHGAFHALREKHLLLLLFSGRI